MDSYASSVQVVPTGLQNLVRQATESDRPVWVTTEENSAPVAVLLGVDAYQQIERQRWQLYQMRLSHLSQWLDRVDEQWDDTAVKEQCIQAWQDEIKSVWEVAPEPVVEFCAALTLSVKKLQIDRLSKAQILALRYCVGLLLNPEPDENSRRKAHELLNKSGLSPMFSLDKETVQLYLD